MNIGCETPIPVCHFLQKYLIPPTLVLLVSDSINTPSKQTNPPNPINPHSAEPYLRNPKPVTSDPVIDGTLSWLPCKEQATQALRGGGAAGKPGPWTAPHGGREALIATPRTCRRTLIFQRKGPHKTCTLSHTFQLCSCNPSSSGVSFKSQGGSQYSSCLSFLFGLSFR